MAGRAAVQPATETEKVTFRSLPHKRQLAVLTFARLAEPLVGMSLQSYMFYQLKSFDPSLPDSTIATQAGILFSSFTGAQTLTAMIWGRLSDSEKVGRKMVVMIGIFGTTLSVLGFGFSRSFWQAALFRTLGGALNGNLGVMRTMISEIVQEKKYQSRAFLLFPMCFNIGVIIGPILGGLLADPASNYPSWFGDVAWMKKYPYALPNLVSAAILFSAFLGIFFGLNETLVSIRHQEDFGSKCRKKIVQVISRSHSRKHSYDYVPLRPSEDAQTTPDEDTEMAKQAQSQPKAVPRFRHRLPFKRMFTRNVTFTLLAYWLISLHLGTFNSLWFVFLSTPVADPKHPNPPDFRQRLPFVFTGGLGMPPRHIGFAMSILGAIGISMQLFVYPKISDRFGTIKTWRFFLYFFPIAYALVPFLSLIPSKTPPPSEKDGPLIWISLCCVLFILVAGRTFALPASTILLNNSSPHPSVLGTLHGIGQSLSTSGRAIGPAVGGVLYGLGLERGVVGGVWWTMSGLALLNCVASLFVFEGDGHEIWLDGDREAEEEFQASISAQHSR